MVDKTYKIVDVVAVSEETVNHLQPGPVLSSAIVAS
jgi:hypothetical protein